MHVESNLLIVIASTERDSETSMYSQWDTVLDCVSVFSVEKDIVCSVVP